MTNEQYIEELRSYDMTTEHTIKHPYRTVEEIEYLLEQLESDSQDAAAAALSEIEIWRMEWREDEED